MYEAKAECDGRTKIYNGLCETEFKVRFYNHSQSFKHRSKSKATELSKFIWNCKDAGFKHPITYESPHSNAEKVSKSDRIQNRKSTYFLTLKLIVSALKAKLFK